jgi:solute carrier family 25, member 33/36
MQLQSSIVSTSAGGSLVNARGNPFIIAKSIIQQDGFAGFFRGLPPTLFGIIPSRSAYFYAYQKCQHLLSNLDHTIGTFTLKSKNQANHMLETGSPINSMLSGLAAGLVSNTITNPIWMIKTRMTLMADVAAGQKNYRNYYDVIRSILQEEGIPGFYKGIQASYWGCFEGSIQFLLYEQIKGRLIQRKQNHHSMMLSSSSLSGVNKNNSNKNNRMNIELSMTTYFWSAAISKMLASIMTYPHEVVRTRLREQARSGLFKYKGMWQSIILIAKEEGRVGLYSGMGVHLLKVVPNSALMFVTWEMVRRYLNEYTVVD